MSLDAKGLTSKLASHLLRTGLFRKVNKHEPASAPGTGLVAAVFLSSVTPSPQHSGTAVTSARVVFTIRVYAALAAGNDASRDAIDPDVLHAVDVVLGHLNTDFTLDGTILAVDLLGQAGIPLGAQAGYQTIDGKAFRVVDITAPLIVGDVWTQGS